MKALLKEGGAKKEFYISDLVTHVITENSSFAEKEECVDKLTVKSTWVIGFVISKYGFIIC